MNGASIAILGPHSYIDYIHTVRHVAGQYGVTRQNWSLMSGFSRIGDLFSLQALSSRGVFLGTALLLVVTVSALALADHSNLRADFAYSLYVVTMTFLSPTCWSHYFVVLILPLSILANRALRISAASSLMFICFFFLISIPDYYTIDVLRPVEPCSAHELRWGCICFRLWQWLG